MSRKGDTEFYIYIFTRTPTTKVFRGFDRNHNNNKKKTKKDFIISINTFFIEISK